MLVSLPYKSSSATTIFLVGFVTNKFQNILCWNVDNTSVYAAFSSSYIVYGFHQSYLPKYTLLKY